jgi:hypothetical protein
MNCANRPAEYLDVELSGDPIDEVDDEKVAAKMASEQVVGQSLLLWRLDL